MVSLFVVEVCFIRICLGFVCLNMYLVTTHKNVLSAQLKSLFEAYSVVVY